MTTENKGEALERALEVVQERENTHGGVYENHKHIAEMWSAFLGYHIEAWEVAAMMTMLKWSRAKVGAPVKDHFVDVAGYADCAWVCHEHEQHPDVDLRDIIDDSDDSTAYVYRPRLDNAGGDDE